MQETPQQNISAIQRFVVTVLIVGGAFFVSIVLWGWALSMTMMPWIIGGLIVGGLIGGWNGLIVASQRSDERAREMSVAAGGIFLPIATVIGVVAVVVGVIRSIF